MLDTIHGAAVIAKKMEERGLDATALEVYHHMPDVSGFDLIVAPVHLWPGNPVMAEARRMGRRTITHHRAVGEILESERDFEVFEVTGTHSKTSTALLLSRLLSASSGKVVSHTTRGIELWDGGRSRVLGSGLSITPGSVIKAFEAAGALHPKAIVSEVSLGGTGLADYNILTSFGGDYRIAGGTMWASTAKLQMISLARPGTRLIANTDTRIAPDLSFGPGGTVRFSAHQIKIGEKKVPLVLGDDLDLESYTTAISAASAAALAAGMDTASISEALEGFDGFGGRMKKTVVDGIVIYDNSNSGLRVSGVERALDLARGEGKLGLVVGEEAETVCEGVDVDRLVELLRRRRQEIDLLVLVGERMEPYAQDLDTTTARDLDAGLDFVTSVLGPGDRLLSCVKCFR